MAIFDIFKKKKKAEEKKEGKEGRPNEKPSTRAKLGAGLVPHRNGVSGAGLTKKAKSIKRRMDGAYRILKTPHITEKATDLMENNQYIFKVYENSNKQEVKKAVESVYGVDVVSVKIINIPRKRKRLGKSPGWKKGGKKAIVRIKKGQEIEIVPR